MSLQPASRHLLAPAQRLRLIPKAPPLSFHRNASSSNSKSPIKPTRKPIVLEKPSKFNPPSHPARMPRRPPIGARLPTYQRTEKEKEETGRKQYPHMMPPEGTFLHWFLTNRVIHVWISMSILTSLAFFTWLTNFLNTTPYRANLPPNNFFFSHPFAFLRQYFDVYRLHTEFVSQQTAEHRRQKVEDVRKRSEYRAAHGLDGQSGLGGWTVKGDGEVMGGGMKEGGDVGSLAQDIGNSNIEGEFVDFEGKRRPVRKWLGIW